MTPIEEARELRRLSEIKNDSISSILKLSIILKIDLIKYGCKEKWRNWYCGMNGELCEDCKEAIQILEEIK